jgi:hypothetical protein
VLNRHNETAGRMIQHPGELHDPVKIEASRLVYRPEDER